MRKINVLIVDDHQMIRDGIRTMLDLYQNKYIVDEADTVDATLKKIQINNYDIILMDYQLRVLTGAQLTKRMLTDNPELKIIGMSAFIEGAGIKAMIDAGVIGFLPKGIGPTELDIAFETALDGKEYYPPEIRERLLENPSKEENIILTSGTENDLGIKVTKNEKIHLTKREKQVIHHLALKKKSKEIAKIYGIAKGTVDGVRANLLRKFNVKNTAAAIQIAIEFGINKDKAEK